MARDAMRQEAALQEADEGRGDGAGGGVARWGEGGRGEGRGKGDEDDDFFLDEDWGADGEGAGRSEARGGGREGGGGSESGSEGEDESDSESDSEHESGDEGHASLPHVSRVREVASQILPLMESEGLQLADDAEREEKLQEKTGQRGMGAGEMGGSSEAVGGCRMK